MTEATPLAFEQITQEDREAAATLAQWLTNAQNDWEGMVPWFADDAPRAFREGAFDGHDYIQAFARHRIAALSASRAPSGQGVSGEDKVWPPSQIAPGEPIGALLICDQTGGRMWTCWPVPHMKRQHADSIYADTGGYRTVPLYATPAPSCAPGEVATTVSDDEICRIFAMQAFEYATHKGSTGLRPWCEANGVTVSHASTFANGLREPCNDLLAALGLERVTRVLPAALSPQGLDAKEGEQVVCATCHSDRECDCGERLDAKEGGE